MVRGAFKRFVHDHVFMRDRDGTIMTDRLEFEAPGGILGRLIDRLVLTSYLARFLEQRNEVIKRIAESEGEWRQYLSQRE